MQRGDGVIRPYKVGAVDVFAGALVSVVQATGFAQRSGDTSGHKFVGVADKNVKNSTGAAGSKKVRVWARGVFPFACTGADQTWTGQKVYAVDDQTVALAATTTNDVLVGVVTEVVSATQVFVALTPDS
jgi:predicted RecA/RadA family phage recombinase